MKLTWEKEPKRIGGHWIEFLFLGKSSIAKMTKSSSGKSYYTTINLPLNGVYTLFERPLYWTTAEEARANVEKQVRAWLVRAGLVNEPKDDEHPPTEYIKRKEEEHALAPHQPQCRKPYKRRQSVPRVSRHVRGTDRGSRTTRRAEHDRPRA